MIVGDDSSFQNENENKDWVTSKVRVFYIFIGIQQKE